MLDPTPDIVSLAALFTQFGSAGLMGWMWLSERKGAQTRDTQLAELQTRLLQERLQFDSLVSLARDCARAVGTLDAGQRQIADRLSDLIRLLTKYPVVVASSPQPVADRNPSTS